MSALAPTPVANPRIRALPPVAMTGHSKIADGTARGVHDVRREGGEATHWTAAAMAKAASISASSVRRIWHAHGLEPHRLRRFKLSNDPDFAIKLRDVVGLYVDPPAHAVVLSVDEKSQIQALDHTQPGHRQSKSA